MLVFLARRIFLGFLALLVVSVLVFMATNLLPGDPATAILGREATPEKLEAIRNQLGLDESVVARYGKWFAGIVTLDFGNSLTQGVGAFGESEGAGTPVSTLIGSSIANTTYLAATGLILLVALSLTLGAYAAIRHGSIGDTAIQVIGLVFIALPEFVLGALLILLFAFVWPVLPAVSYQVSVKGLALPVMTLVLSMLGVTSRLVRVGVLEVLQSNYVVNARLRGLPESRILRRHVFPNSLGPTLQVFAMATGLFVGGVVVVEYLFAYPGIGTGFVSAVSGRDYPVVQAYTMILAGTYIVANLVADVITALVNPRVRAGVAK